MTVIAYRAGIMACDSRWSSNGTQTCSAIKIVRLASGALLGSAGDNDARDVYSLLDRVKTAKNLPSRAALAALKLDYEGLLALPKGGVFHIATGKHNDAGYPENDEADFGIWPATTMGGYAACGSGYEIALGAMDAGAGAKQAVQVACRRNIYCSLPVHAVKLHVARLDKLTRRK